MGVFKRGKLNLIIDLQFGSTGKGKIARYLAEKEEISAAVCNFSPNSAHTSVEDDGRAFIVKQLPQAAALVQMGADIELFIGAEACINPKVLLAELEQYPRAAKFLKIHPNAAIITQEHIDQEAASLVRISSTLQGTAFARAAKTTRSKSAVIARGHSELGTFVSKDFDGDLWAHFNDPTGMVLGEFHQGYELSINSQFYPFVTSSIVNTSQFLAALNLPPRMVGTVVGSARTYPIRVGNVKDDAGNVVGYSGDVYPDQQEYTWEQITEMAGASYPLMEQTTLTKKVRRIFSFSFPAMKAAARANGVDVLFLNFVNYLSWKVNEQSNEKEDCDFAPEIWQFVERVERECGVRVAWLGTGPKNSHLITLDRDLLDVI